MYTDVRKLWEFHGRRTRKSVRCPEHPKHVNTLGANLNLSWSDLGTCSGTFGVSLDMQTRRTLAQTLRVLLPPQARSCALAAAKTSASELSFR